MARPSRNNVDYFPFLCKEGKAMFYIETTYGNDGYATWVKLLRELAVANNHYLNLGDKVNLMFLASKCRITQETLLKILNDLSDLGEIDKELWEEAKVVWSQKFIDHIQDAYSKRSNKCIDLDSLRVLLLSLRVLKPSKSHSKGSINPQSKEEKSKEEKSNLYRSFKHLSISIEEKEKLISEGFTKTEIDDTLDSIENYKNNKNYTSLILTCRNWMKNDRKKTPISESKKSGYKTPEPIDYSKLE